jgi:uncharacterized protein YkwD
MVFVATLVSVTLPVWLQVHTAPVQAAVNLSDRAAVIASYTAEFGRVEPDARWTGDVTTCTPGTTSAEYQASVLQRVNWFRDMAGLPPVTLDVTKNVYAQAGALISAANRKLTHFPEPTATCFSADGYSGTSKSNLHGISGVAAINDYIHDYGADNTRVGHRSWILHPRLGTLATGDIPNRANALYVVTDWVPRVTPRDGAVAWPPAGYVPDAVVYSRWSYHRHGADFTSAQVSVTGPNGAVSTTVVHNDGYLDAGIVFEPRYTNATNAQDVTYTVNISGIGGTGASSVTYNVTLVHVNRAPMYLATTYVLDPEPVCTGAGTKIASVLFADLDDTTLRYSLSGADASYFTIDDTATVYTAKVMDLNRVKYSVIVTATDSQGATVSSPLDYMFTSLEKTKACPPHQVRAKAIPGGVTVSWNAPPAKGPVKGYLVQIKEAKRTCSTTKTTCTITKLAVDTYSVRVWTLGADSSDAYAPKITVTVTEAGAASTSSKPPGTRNIKRGGRIVLSTLSAGIKGKKTYKASGGCRISSAKRYVVAPGRKSVCRVTISYRNGTKRAVRTVNLKVV